MLEILTIILERLVSPFTMFNDIINVFVKLLVMIPAPFMILIAVVIVVFVVRLIPL